MRISRKKAGSGSAATTPPPSGSRDIIRPAHQGRPFSSGKRRGHIHRHFRRIERYYPTLSRRGTFHGRDKISLSGDVTQTFNINLGDSSNTEIERNAVEIASYGKQLGRIGDALIVLLKHVRLESLPEEDEKAIVDLKCMLHEMANLKKEKGAKHILWPALK